MTSGTPNSNKNRSIQPLETIRLPLHPLRSLECSKTSNVQRSDDKLFFHGNEDAEEKGSERIRDASKNLPSHVKKRCFRPDERQAQPVSRRDEAESAKCNESPFVSRGSKILAQNLSSQQISQSLQNPLKKVVRAVDTSLLPYRNPIQPSIDLTNDSDEEVLPASDCPSREDLLKLTGSTSTATNSTDLEVTTSFSQTTRLDSCTEDSGCTFLEKFWVGQDKAVVFKSRENVRCFLGTTNTSSHVCVKGTVTAPGIGSFALTAEDLSCLQGPEWLNDEVVNAYMCLLQIRSNLASQNAQKDDMNCAQRLAETRLSELEDHEFVSENAHLSHSNSLSQNFPKSLFYSSFFYALLRNSRGGYSYSNVQRWGRKHNILEMDRVFFPINISNSHWCLAVVFPSQLTIRYYDSLGGRNSHCLDLLERYLKDEGRSRGEEKLTRDWAKESFGPPQIPGQSDGCSCGVFVCAFADCLSAGMRPEGFSQHDMPTIRRRFYDFFIRCRMWANTKGIRCPTACIGSAVSESGLT